MAENSKQPAPKQIVVVERKSNTLPTFQNPPSPPPPPPPPKKEK